MEMGNFILATFGRELARVCTYDRGDVFRDAILADLPEIHEQLGIVTAEIRWWKDGELKRLSRYEFTRLVKDQADSDGEYEPDEELPPTPGYKLQVALITARGGCVANPADDVMIDEAHAALCQSQPDQPLAKTEGK